MVEDLLFLRNVLAGAGLDYLLVRGNNDRPVIALDWKNRKKLRAALVEACRNEPVYSMTVDAKKKSSVLVADGELSRNRQARIFRLYRPRVEPDGGFEFGSSAGVQIGALELRRRPADPAHRELADPANHARRRTQSAAPWNGTATPGRPSRTCSRPRQRHQLRHRPGLLLGGRQLAEYIAARRARMAGCGARRRRRPRGAVPADQRTEVCPASVYMFAPWIRRIFIATDSPAPEWLAEHPSVTHRPQRGVLRGPVGAAHAQLAGRGVPAAQHRGPLGALPVLQ